MGSLHKFWHLTRREKQFCFESAILLLLAKFCIRTIPFRHIENFLRRPWSELAHGTIDRADEIRLVEVSLSRTVRLLQWKDFCLSRSIAAFIMLRRRGIPTLLLAGVKVSENSSLRAHAWIQTGYPVTDGASENSGFTPVVRIGLDPLIADSARNPLVQT